MPEVELKKIQPNRLNPRLEFSKAELDELADSVREVGIIEPIIVRPIKKGYEVIVGERRYRAAHQAGLNKVPVIVRNYTDDKVMQLNLIENIQREDLSAVEKGKLCKKLMEKFPEKFPTQRKLAKALGVSELRVSEWMPMTLLPEKVQKLVAPTDIRRKLPRGRITHDVALTIARKIKEPERQVKLAEELAAHRVTYPKYREVISEVAKEPKKPVREVFKEVIEEAPIYLPFSKAHGDAILKGVKTQTARKGISPGLKPNTIVHARITHFADLEVINVARKKLGDFDEKDAKREGGYTLEEFKKIWKNLHGEWNPNESVYVIQFKLAKVV